MDPSRHINVLGSKKYRLQVEKTQTGNRRIFYLNDKLTKISQPLTFVGLLILGVSISEKAGWYRQQKISRHVLSELVEHDGINFIPARIRINRIIFRTKAFSIKTISTSKVPAI